MNTTDYCLWLVMVFGTGNPKIWQMIEHFGNPEKAFEELKNNPPGFLKPKELEAIRTTHMEQCKIVMENCLKRDIKVISYYDENYPKQLENIVNPPLVLFAKGDISVVNDLCITVVGTREPSAYSVKVAEKICFELAKIGVVIVSGFALGIDSVSHRSAIIGKGRTIAVLGCGIDVDYPKENAKSKSVMQKRGLMLTEFLPGTKPIPSNFPKRNRILSAMGIGTLIIEASLTSGSLITAEYALEQGRDLFCIPPADIFDNRYSGVIKYLRDGAIPVFSHLDIVREYYTAFTHKLSSINDNTDYYAPLEKLSEKAEMKIIPNIKKDKKQEIPEKSDKDKLSENKDYSCLNDEQLEIVKILKDGIKYIDELSVLSGKEISSLYIILTEMEMDGIVECLPGKAYKLI